MVKMVSPAYLKHANELNDSICGSSRKIHQQIKHKMIQSAVIGCRVSCDFPRR